MKNILFVLGATILLSACGSNESNARKAVRDSLKDSESAKFGEFTIIGDKEDAACLTVNAKNSFGGYTGNQDAYLRKDEAGWHIVSMTEKSHNDCVLAAKKVSFKENENDRKPTLSDPKYIPIEGDNVLGGQKSFTTNLMPEGNGEKFVIAKFKVRVVNEQAEQNINNYKPEINAKINGLLQTKVASELGTDPGKDKLISQIKKLLADVISCNLDMTASSSDQISQIKACGIEEVFITSLIVQ